jgi:hypothetical protein
MINTVNLAYYRKEDWDYFLSIIDDRENMHETWEEWFKAYTKLKVKLMSEGFFIKEVTVNIRELMAYCMTRNIKNDGAARSQFVQTK